MVTVPAHSFCAPARAKLIAALRSMPGVCAVLGSSECPGMTRTPSCFHLVSVTGASLNLNQLDRLTARAFDHYGAGFAEWVGRLQDHHTFAAQFHEPCVEIADAQRNVIVELPARGRERRIALVRVPGQ